MCCFIEVQAPSATIRRRLDARARSTAEISDARLEDFAALARAYEPPTELRPPQLIAVKSARTWEAVVAAVLKALARQPTLPPSRE